MKKESEHIDFNELFKQIPPEEICDRFNIFSLVGEDFFLVTAGKKDNYNSMTGSGGGFGLHFRKPSTMCIFQSDRYTLELIQKEQTYTLSYFSDEYKKQLIFLGNKSGRNSQKMQEVELASIQTPSGDVSFKEAKLIIECKLMQIMTAYLEDFYSQEAKDYLKDVYKEESNYRKYVFGEITNVWVKNNKRSSRKSASSVF